MEENSRQYALFHNSPGDEARKHINGDVVDFKVALESFLEGADINDYKVDVHPVAKS